MFTGRDLWSSKLLIRHIKIVQKDLWCFFSSVVVSNCCGSGLCPRLILHIFGFRCLSTVLSAAHLANQARALGYVVYPIVVTEVFYSSNFAHLWTLLLIFGRIHGISHASSSVRSICGDSSSYSVVVNCCDAGFRPHLISRICGHRL